MKEMKLEQIGGKVRGTITIENRHVNFEGMMEAIHHCNIHGFVVSNANELPKFFSQFIVNTPKLSQ